MCRTEGHVILSNGEYSLPYMGLGEGEGGGGMTNAHTPSLECFPRYATSFQMRRLEEVIHRHEQLSLEEASIFSPISGSAHRVSLSNQGGWAKEDGNKRSDACLGLALTRLSFLCRSLPS